MRMITACDEGDDKGKSLRAMGERSINKNYYRSSVEFKWSTDGNERLLVKFVSAGGSRQYHFYSLARILQSAVCAQQIGVDGRLRE